jgi:hypothetical protein
MGSTSPWESVESSEKVMVKIGFTGGELVSSLLLRALPRKIFLDLNFSLLVLPERRVRNLKNMVVVIVTACGDVGTTSGFVSRKWRFFEM